MTSKVNRKLTTLVDNLVVKTGLNLYPVPSNVELELSLTKTEAFTD